MHPITAIVGPSGRRDFFHLAPGFGMKQRTWNGTEWSHHWIQLGGTFTTVGAVVCAMARQRPVVATGGAVAVARAEPAEAGAALGTVSATAASTAAGVHVGGHHDVVTGATSVFPLVERVDLFGLGLDYAMYHKQLWGDPADHPGPWQSLGGSFTSAPAAIVLGGHIHVFGLGTDYAMYHRAWNGTWSPGWERLGGFFSSAPVVVSPSPDRLDVFARGADFTLRHRTLEGGAWTTDWQNLGGSLASPPVAVSWGANRLDVFAIRRDDRAIVHRWWDGEFWNDWEHVAGGANDVVFTSMPSAVSWAPERFDVFAVGADEALYHVWSEHDAWSPPESLGGRFAAAPAVISAAPNHLQIIGPGVDANLYHKQWTGGSWQPAGWEQLGDRVALPTRYLFAIDGIRVQTARSLNSDTDTGQCSLAIGNWPLSTVTQHQGDLGGTHVKEGQTNLMRIGPVTVELCESAIFNYTFVNSSADVSAVDQTLAAQGTKLADFGLKTIVKDIGAGIGITSIEVAGSIAPLMGTLLGVLAGWLVGELNSIINANCDGVVAAEQVVMMGRELHEKTRHGPMRMTTIHPGSSSPSGCGANSKYEVGWSILAD
jgi:hypothetical protein